MKHSTDNARGRQQNHSPEKAAAPLFFKNLEDDIETILNRLISKQDYGFKWKGKKNDPHPVHCNTQEELLAYYTGTLKGRDGKPKRWLSSITLAKWDRHFKGLETFYFTGQTNAPYTLVMIDIDCHSKGAYAGAVQCAQYLKNTFFPGLFFEASTHLNGVHGYFILRSEGMTPEEVNAWETQLQTALATIQHQFDVEMIEVKGHCHVVERVGRRTVNVRCGTLAKCPRTAKERKNEFLGTTVVDPHTFVMPQAQAQAKESVIEKKPKTKKPVGARSTSGHCIQDWRTLLPLAKEMLGGRHGKLVGDVRVMPEDVAVLLAITYYCAAHMNSDGSLPTNRIKGFWNALYKGGETERAFVPRRYKATRDFLDAASGIDWKSHHYTTGVACKWQLTEEMMGLVEACGEEKENKENKENKATSFVSGRTWLLKPTELITRPQRLVEEEILPDEVARAIGWRTAA